jgi:probable biosynthetic protein (TIGR04098 family)
MIRVNLPHMDAAGLSEGWLFRHSGNLHWDRLCAALHTPSHELADDDGVRLYPVFIAIRARYDRPLSTVVENERLRSAVDLAHYGRAFFRSAVRVGNAAGSFALEMLTTFAARDRAGVNHLHRTTPASGLRYDVPELRAAPQLLLDRHAMARGLATTHHLASYAVDLTRVAAAPCELYDPSPYTDFNGVGLLYFAAYPAIVDTLERRLLRRTALAPSIDWALATSTIARDVFYYRNLDLGERLIVALNSVARVPQGYLLHSILSREHDGAVLADVVTLKQDVSKARLLHAERCERLAPEADVAPALSRGQLAREPRPSLV